MDRNEAVWRAASVCDVALLKTLLKEGAPAAHDMGDGRGTPVHAAVGSAMRGAHCLDTLRLLASAGASLSEPDSKNGRTPLDVATEADRVFRHPKRNPLALFVASLASGEWARTMAGHSGLLAGEQAETAPS